MAEFKHDHPGQKEPRAPGEIHHENRIVDLNTAPEEELADMPMVGPKRARELMQHRPFKLWDDVQKVLGFDTGMVDDLKSGGARESKPPAAPAMMSDVLAGSGSAGNRCYPAPERAVRWPIPSPAGNRQAGGRPLLGDRRHAVDDDLRLARPGAVPAAAPRPVHHLRLIGMAVDVIRLGEERG
jgi:Helix-hairpin-helix motif